MKKLLFALCALAAIALLTPSAGFAQWQNRIGIYTSATAAATSINPVPATFSVYFVLTNPTQNGVPLTQVKGWEYHVTIVGNLDGLIRTADILPANTLNLGDANDPYNAMYLCGLATPMAVTDGAELDTVVLHRWNFFCTDQTTAYYFYLNPATPATFAGQLAFLNATNGKIAASASQTDYGDAVFAVGGTPDPVAIQSESFGAVKALFR